MFASKELSCTIGHLLIMASSVSSFAWIFFESVGIKEEREVYFYFGTRLNSAIRSMDIVFERRKIPLGSRGFLLH